MATNKNTADAVREALEDKINSLGYSVWDVEYVKEGADYHLIITIDSENGINIDDCEKVHRFVDPILDELNPIENAYILQVSSPGVERTLRTPAHYKSSIGEKVILKLFTSRNGSKQIKGTLVSFDESTGSIGIREDNGKDSLIDIGSVSRANIYFDFSSID